MAIGQKNLTTENPRPAFQELATSIHTTRNPRNYAIKPQWFDVADSVVTPTLSAAAPSDHKDRKRANSPHNIPVVLAGTPFERQPT